MKILSLHVDYIKFKPLKKALKSAELTKEEEKEREIKEALVILTAVESGDTEETTKSLIKNIKDIASQVKTKNIVLYPYAHLSSNLSSPKIAVEIMKDAESKLKKQNYKVTRAPFGYYKEFELKVKGHPLSELSREISSSKESKEEKISEKQRKELLKKMTKLHMSVPKGKSGLKSNVELGRELDIYIVSEIVGKGLPLLTPKGTTIKREIENFVTNEELKRGYLYTSTPIMAKSDLYKISGHWQHYKDSMFILNIGKEQFALRPMTCPFQFILYKRKPRSYTELPLKYAEISTLFRNEQTGELRGLTRVRQFTLADAHVICTPSQLEKEFEQVLDLINYVMKSLGVKDIWYRFSRADLKDKEKYIDNPKAWKESEKIMKKILDKLKIKYIEAKGEAAFYGPKLDLQYKDVYGKEDTLITVQIDFALPELFDLTYKDKNNKLVRPMIIHRSSSGATERMIAYLLEKTQGNLPLWLSPIQVKVLSMTDRNNKAAEKIFSQLKQENIRVELDNRQESMAKKVRDAQLEKIPYMITIGDKEQASNTLAVRSRDTGKVKFGVKLLDFISQLKKEIEEKNKIKNYIKVTKYFLNGHII